MFLFVYFKLFITWVRRFPTKFKWLCIKSIYTSKYIVHCLFILFHSPRLTFNMLTMTVMAISILIRYGLHPCNTLFAFLVVVNNCFSLCSSCSHRCFNFEFRFMVVSIHRSIGWQEYGSPVMDWAKCSLKKVSCSSGMRSLPKNLVATLHTHCYHKPSMLVAYCMLMTGILQHLLHEMHECIGLEHLSLPRKSPKSPPYQCQVWHTPGLLKSVYSLYLQD